MDSVEEIEPTQKDKKCECWMRFFAPRNPDNSRRTATKGTVCNPMKSDDNDTDTLSHALSGFTETFEGYGSVEECEFEILKPVGRDNAGVFFCNICGHSVSVFIRSTPPIDMDQELMK